MITAERAVKIESIRIRTYRKKFWPLDALRDSIGQNGWQRPLVLWKDGTLISGSRRLRAAIISGKTMAPAIFVDTVEDVAKALHADNTDLYLARQMKPSEICLLWELIRRLDEPAAVLRAAEHRRRGVQLREATKAGKRDPGRSGAKMEDYVLSQLSPAFGVSVRTATRLWRIHSLAYVAERVPDEDRKAARQALDDLDSGILSVWAAYQKVANTKPTPEPLPDLAPAVAAPVDRQQAVWAKALPQLEGLTAGLVELGPPNKSLTWEQVGPVHARLMAVRRDLEKLIKKMRESNQS